MMFVSAAKMSETAKMGRGTYAADNTNYPY